MDKPSPISLSICFTQALHILIILVGKYKWDDIIEHAKWRESEMPKNVKNSPQFQEPETPSMREQNYHITVKVKYLYRCLRSHCWVHTIITDI